MQRNDKLSCVGWCDKLGILSTTDVEMVPWPLGVDSGKLPITTPSTDWTRRRTRNIVWWDLHFQGLLSENWWLLRFARWEESSDQRIMLVEGDIITITFVVGDRNWFGGCGRGNGSHSCRTTFLFQEIFPTSGISSEGGRAGLLLILLWSQGQGCLLPGVKTEGKGRTYGEGEVDFHALVGQRLAESQALDGQRGVSITHCSHFGLLLNQ